MNARGQITVAFRSFAFYNRNVAMSFTGAFHTFLFFRRNYLVHFTAAFRSFALYSRNESRKGFDIRLPLAFFSSNRRSMHIHRLVYMFLHL